MKAILALAATSLLATAAVAQQQKPLNLNLPPDFTPTPVAASSAPAPASTSAAPGASGKESVAVTRSRPLDPPGTYYGDTSGRMAGADVADDTPDCDDATYNKPQVHGSVSTGVVSASHGYGGSYQAGTVNLSQAFGSCDHPKGGVSISIGGGQDNFGHGRGRW
ncbi:hypothetical protein SAMN02800692_3514 [Luteibacter sp. UNC138MFCol5.1]|uniref:hypothetical protein n=1 Tax=Luteibacter sp. UNC138MFCol5.1 TaxID=1502774 RepID=UPI0008D80118|nr:hypothetical protein [Luteibacter sp. UNC138MFCol5.1]SEP06717.1 hypothetical protein SAMN02800692_3514 [Luteibacter sp. UNC138MFCol5.1]